MSIASYIDGLPRTFSWRMTQPNCLVCQVAGRLHVEVWRGTEHSEAEAPEPPDAQQNVTDGEPQERKLDCVVSTRSFHSVPDQVI